MAAPKDRATHLFQRGARYGKWTVLDPGPSVGNRERSVRVRCDCGRVAIQRRSTLKSGASKQCHDCSMLELWGKS